MNINNETKNELNRDDIRNIDQNKGLNSEFKNRNFFPQGDQNKDSEVHRDTSKPQNKELDSDLYRGLDKPVDQNIGLQQGFNSEFNRDFEVHRDTSKPQNQRPWDENKGLDSDLNRDISQPSDQNKGSEFNRDDSRPVEPNMALDKMNPEFNRGERDISRPVDQNSGTGSHFSRGLFISENESKGLESDRNRDLPWDQNTGSGFDRESSRPVDLNQRIDQNKGIDSDLNPNARPWGEQQNLGSGVNKDSDSRMNRDIFQGSDQNKGSEFNRDDSRPVEPNMALDKMNPEFNRAAK